MKEVKSYPLFYPVQAETILSFLYPAALWFCRRDV